MNVKLQERKTDKKKFKKIFSTVDIPVMVATVTHYYRWSRLQAR